MTIQTISQTQHFNNFTVLTVNTPVGGGKTQAAIEYAVTHAAQGRKIAICQPTKILIDETKRRIEGEFAKRHIGIPVRSIYSEGPDSGSVRQIVEHIAKCRAGRGEIILITHAALMRLPKMSRATEWGLILDEVPQIDWTRQINLAEHLAEFSQWVDARPYNSTYVELIPRDTGAVDEVSENEREDEFWALLRDFTYRLNSPHWLVLASAESYAAFLHGESNSLSVSAILQPEFLSDWQSVTLMSAVLDQTMLVRYWETRGIEFKPHDEIRPVMQCHQNGNLLEILYAHEADNSRQVRETTVQYGNERVPVEEICHMRVLREFESQPWVYLANTNASRRVLDMSKTGRQLPNSPHGLNEFREIHQVAVFSALNPPPAHIVFVRDLAGLTSEEFRSAGYRQSVYQAVGRISLRDPRDTNRKRVVVMDRATAFWLQGLFPNSTVRQLADLPNLNTDEAIGVRQTGRVQIHSGLNERVRSHRKYLIAKLISQLDEVNKPSVTKDLKIRDFVTDNSTSNPPERGNLFRINNGHPIGTTFDLSNDELVQLLADSSNETYGEKSDNVMISPSEFDPSRTQDEIDPEKRTKRGLANVVRCRGVWLDNDSGGPSPAEMGAMFPHQKIIFYSTHSSKPGAERYRALFLTDCYLTPDVYKFIVAEIINRLQKKGYYSESYFRKYANDPARLEGKRRHGFDESKFHAASMFYMPCQSQHGPDATFFQIANPDAEPLDPYQWVDRTTQRPRPEIEQAPPRAVNENDPMAVLERNDRVQQIRDEWRAETTTNNAAFFGFARRLYQAGLSDRELTEILSSDAVYAHDPAERRKSVNGIVRKLRYGYGFR